MSAPELAELLELSRAVGSDPDVVQGGGGNTSVKSRDGRTMFVKASGVALAAMDETRGWAELDRRATTAFLGDESLRNRAAAPREREVLARMKAAVLRPAGVRPSVESSLHALLDRVVVHTHPVGLNAFLSCHDSRDKYRQLLAGVDAEPIYVPYVDPGFTLARTLEHEVAAYRARHFALPRVVLLENHGVFVADDEVAPCLERSDRIVDAGRRWIDGLRVNVEPPRPAEEDAIAGRIREALSQAGFPAVIVARDGTRLAEDCASDGSWRTLAEGGAMTPDQIVYCRTYPLVLHAEDGARWPAEVCAYAARHGIEPRVVIVPGTGVYAAAANETELVTVQEVYRTAIVAVRFAEKGGGARFLTRDQAGFIESWEAEHYRAGVARA